jgi:hypothetical protein
VSEVGREEIGHDLPISGIDTVFVEASHHVSVSNARQTEFPFTSHIPGRAARVVLFMP